MTDLYNLYLYAKKTGYKNLDKIKDLIENNCDKIEYKNENNEISILIDILSNESFDQNKILKSCKYSHLIRLKDILTDINILKKIIDIILQKRTDEIEDLKKQYEKKRIKDNW